MQVQQVPAIADSEILARYIRDPQHFHNRRRHQKKRGETLDFVDLIPFRLFRPQTGEQVSSLVRRRYGNADTAMHAADVDAVAFIEFEAACTRLVEVSVESGIVSLSVKADPLEGFDSHAILFSQEIDVKRYPKQRGEEMDNELRKLLTQLYEKLFAMCGVPQLIPETLGEVTS